MKLNPNEKVVLAIRKRLEVCDGYCPCVPDSVGQEDYKCPCKKMREENKCCCKLYVNDENN